MGETMLAVEKLKENFGSEIVEVTETAGQVSVTVRRDRIVDILRFLHNDGELLFDHLADLCGVDWLGKKTPRFEVVYNLFSIRYKRYIRIKAQVPEEDPRIDSVAHIWKTANWLERECYDMFGIVFEGHPDLRRLLMPEDWEGYPLRKDYPLFLEEDQEWKGFKELKQKARELAVYDWYPMLLEKDKAEEASQAEAAAQEEGHGTNA